MIMKKNIDLIIDGIAPEKVMYDTDNHSLVVLYPAQEEFKRGDIVIHDNTKRISVFDKLRNNNLGFDAIFGLSRFNEVHDYCSWNTRTLRHATPQEIEQFDNDLKSIGKKWNAETLQVEDLDISEIVVDLVSACEYLEIKRPSKFILDEACERSNKFEAQMELQLICEAWNKFDGFEVDWSDDEQSKYYPVLDVYGDIKCLVSWETAHISDSCYSFSTEERALQFGKQFKELFKVAMGL